jgi:hypothetical protein
MSRGPSGVHCPRLLSDDNKLLGGGHVGVGRECGVDLPFLCEQGLAAELHCLREQGSDEWIIRADSDLGAAQ